MLVNEVATGDTILRIKGAEYARLRNSDINIAGTPAAIEAALKSASDSLLSGTGYAMRVHIFDKTIPDYAVCLHPIGQAPIGNWWEAPL